MLSSVFVFFFFFLLDSFALLKNGEQGSWNVKSGTVLGKIIDYKNYLKRKGGINFKL